MSQNKGASRRTQLLALLYSMRQQGKESATFNIAFLLEALQDTVTMVQQPPEQEPEAQPQPGDMDGGQF